MAWIIAKHAHELGGYFSLCKPDLYATVQLLNKELLHAVGAKAGLESPRTFYPATEREALEAINQLGLPVLLKPKTQMGYRSKSKGIVCQSEDQVKREWNKFVNSDNYHRQILEYDRRMALPMIQEFLGNTAHDSFSIGGFVDLEKDYIVGLGSRKIFQRPRRLGVGIAFVAEPIQQIALDQILTLAKAVGYSGVFEAEFLASNKPGSYLLADFNPRFYGQMAFEIARGLPLPILAYAIATKNSGLELSARSAAELAKTGESSAYVNRWTMNLLLRTQFLGGRLTSQEFKHWRSWLNSTKMTHYDALRDHDDPGPLKADIRTQIAHFAKHPRDFFRKFFLDT